jgi:hypothetical protein
MRETQFLDSQQARFTLKRNCLKVFTLIEAPFAKDLNTSKNYNRSQSAASEA